MVYYIRRHMMGSKMLPLEYEQLEYVTVSGNSVLFNTGYVPTKGCKVELLFKGTSTTSTKAGAMFGCRTGWNNKSFYFRTGVSSGTATNMTVYMGYSTERSVSGVDINASSKNLYGLDNGKFYINDTVLGSYFDSFSPVYELYLMKINNSGSPLTAVSSPYGNLYNCRIWDDNGKMVRFYVPVRRVSDNAVGIFDLIYGTFLRR